jgi:hypothetical protein
MTVWDRIIRELKWFFMALALSSLLSLVYFLFYRMIETPDGEVPEFTLKVYLTGWLTMFCCLYVGRAMVRFMRIVMSADTSNHEP